MYLYGDNDKIARVFSDLYRIMIALANVNSTFKIRLNSMQEYYEVIFTIDSMHFDRNEIKNIFQNYYRLDDDKQGKKHVLGLSVAKAIIDMHQGMIRAQSMEEQFSMIILLPKNRKE